ncbi:ATP-binding cassette domain-containing protein [Mesomycoplasma conjunctivae]|uniref:ATP-binding cassette domain-containing protein n=1 Tax=Mesomycoplasma conjunctivae TaxID=45361 RepID=UPI003DA5CBDA
MKIFVLIKMAKLNFFIYFSLIFMENISLSFNIYSYTFIVQHLNNYPQPTFGLTTSILFWVISVFVALSLRLIRPLLSSRIKETIRNQLSFKIIEKIQNSSYVDIKFKSNSMLSLINYDMVEALNMIDSFTTVFNSLIAIITNIIFMILLSPQWSWILILSAFIFSIIGIFFQFFLNQYGQKLSNQFSNIHQELSQYSNKHIQTFKTFFLHNQIFSFKNLIEHGFSKFTSKRTKILKKSSSISLIATFVTTMFTGILLLEVTLLTFYNYYDVSIFLSLMLYSLDFSGSFGDIIVQTFMLSIRGQYLSNIISKVPTTKVNRELNKAIEKISISNLSFVFEDKTLFSGINFDILPGKKYLIDGPSGTGKSTLLKTILGVYPDYQGNILINDELEINQVSSSSLRQQIGFIDNQNIIFDASLQDNITLFDTQVDLQKLNKILDTLKIDWLKLEDNINVNKLSEGQKQKIVLARLKYSNIKFWVVDEALDNIQKDHAELTIDNLLGDPDLTILFVSHHISADLREKFDEVIAIRG